MSRMNHYLKISTLAWIIFLLCVVGLMMLAAGCGRPNEARQIKGAFSQEQTEAFANEIRLIYRWGLTPIDNRNKSNGDFLSDNSLVFYWWDWDGIEPGTLVIAKLASGKTVIHPVKAGNQQTGFKLQGTHNSMPDGYLMFRKNYVGTYVGQLTGNGK